MNGNEIRVRDDIWFFTWNSPWLFAGWAWIFSLWSLWEGQRWHFQRKRWLRLLFRVFLERLFFPMIINWLWRLLAGRLHSSFQSSQDMFAKYRYVFPCRLGWLVFEFHVFWEFLIFKGWSWRISLRNEFRKYVLGTMVLDSVKCCSLSYLQVSPNILALCSVCYWRNQA